MHLVVVAWCPPGAGVLGGTAGETLVPVPGSENGKSSSAAGGGTALGPDGPVVPDADGDDFAPGPEFGRLVFERGSQFCESGRWGFGGGDLDLKLVGQVREQVVECDVNFFFAGVVDGCSADARLGLRRPARRVFGYEDAGAKRSYRPRYGQSRLIRPVSGPKPGNLGAR